MSKLQLTEKDLDRELSDLRERHTNLGDDELFVLWFLRAYVTEDDELARKALTGGSGDKNVDAVLIDDNSKCAVIVQGKRRKKIAGRTEKRNDVVTFAGLAQTLWGDSREFGALADDLTPEVQERLKTVRERLKARHYRLKLVYATLARCSDAVAKEAKRIVRHAAGPCDIEILAGNRILLLLRDYLDGVAPPVPALELEIESGDGVKSGGVLQRFDAKTGIESWIFSMTGSAIAGVFEKARNKIFARNIRGFLEDTPVNKGMEATIEGEPQYFWYYNNGITIICDDAENVRKEGKDILHVCNPQIINGQQTTRTLHRMRHKSGRAAVLVRVITVPRDAVRSQDDFEDLVSQIVAATNWQNAISASDLMANDRRQIEIQKALAALNYHYVRKRMSKREVRREVGRHGLRLVKKEDFAKAVAGCDLDPATMREGVEAMFEEPLYRTVFPKLDPYYYLSRYWLMREVGYASRGYPERGYARWLVLNRVWSQLRGQVQARADADLFRMCCEKDREPVYYLIRAIDIVFDAVLAFYRRKRGKGPKAVDVSSFFRYRNLHTAFARHFARTPYYGRFRRQWKRFVRSLEEQKEG